MNKQVNSTYIGYSLLYLPFILSLIVSFSPNASYLIAWLGSFFIFYLTFTQKIKPLPSDRPVSYQAMRPIFIPHIIFAGYMSIGSIFYFLEKNGYYFFQMIENPEPIDSLFNMAKCQRLYCLGHAALAHSLLLFTNQTYTKPIKTYIYFNSSTSIRCTILFLSISLITSQSTTFEQLHVRFLNIGIVTSALTLALAIAEKKIANIAVSALLLIYIGNNSVYSGMKEQMLIPIILLFVFIFPFYRKVVLFLAPVSLLIFFYFIPSYNTIVRDESWFGELSTEEASEYAMEQMSNGSVDLAKHNWVFLTGRLSEIQMFEKYIEYVPQNREYYKFEILNQSVQTLVPRIIHPAKGITEEIVMQRAYASGAFNPNSAGSAKPPPIVDGYLSFGYLGAWLICFIIGTSSVYISRTAELLFGGYLVGSGIIFSGLFQIFWRGNSMEFMLNTIIWSLIIMALLYYSGIKLQIIHKNS